MQRDQFTWLAYLMLAFYSYTQAALGPLMPFLRAQLNLNYTIAALHVSAFALGMILAGLTADRAAERFGRRVLFWGGGGGMALGGVLLTRARQPILTIASVFVMGAIGSYLLVMVSAVLADHHGERRAVALTEANVAASVSAALAPLVIGLGEESGLSWRIALLIGAGVWLTLLLILRGTPIPANAARSGGRETVRPLPRRFWAYWIVVLLSVALEWCMVFWGADFLENRVGLEKIAASTLMSVFFVAMVIGRVIGARLARHLESSRLLIFAVMVVGVGFPLFWLARVTVLNILGLFLAGLGIANLFPLTLSVATSIDPAQSNKASARVSLAGGLAILLAPQILASLADQVGIYTAFGSAAVFLVVVAVIVVAARRAERLVVVQNKAGAD
jgi:MFS family permease